MIKRPNFLPFLFCSYLDARESALSKESNLAPNRNTLSNSALRSHCCSYSWTPDLYKNRNKLSPNERKPALDQHKNSWQSRTHTWYIGFHLSSDICQQSKSVPRHHYPYRFLGNTADASFRLWRKTRDNQRIPINSDATRRIAESWQLNGRCL